MISFRCCSCGKHFTLADNRIGELLTCSCDQHLRVPRVSGGNARYRTWGDLFIELFVYGGGGAVLGFGLGVLLASQVWPGVRKMWVIVAGLTLLGFLIGTLGGERGINYIGRLIRDREQS